jgi:TolB-like protein/Tfp pilus assembly protein PilF
MVTRDGRIKVLDFGLARPGPGESAPDASQAVTIESPVSVAGTIVGTAPYMAPEQVRGGSTDARTDLFALGVILYELAAGRRPFTGATFADVSSAILRDAPQPLSSLRGDLPADLQRMVGRCLEKSQRERFQTAIDVANELRALQRALDRDPAAVREGPKPAAGEVPSIAVLPFVNMSRDEENEYFSDGLAEELIGVLARIRGLRVAARSSSFAFRGKNAPLSEVGRTLSVSTVLEGSVRKAGNRVRISVQLVKTDDGFHVWSETYDRTLDDIFAVQDDIAQSVVRELRTTLLGAEADSQASGEARAEVVALVQGRGRNPEAHRLFLQGRYFVDRFTEADMVRGIDYLEQAVALDPENAAAWAHLSVAHAHRASYGWAPVAVGFERARAAALKARSLAPDLAEGHAALARVQTNYDFDFRGARASIRRALELAPGHADVLVAASISAIQIGRIEEALDLAGRAVEQDPLSSVIHLRHGSLCRLAGKLDDSDRSCRKALELSPQRIAAHMILALNQLARGRVGEALAEARLEPATYGRLTALAAVHRAAGQEAESDAALKELEARFGDDAAYQVAGVYANRGDNDSAFGWLERAWSQRDPGLTMVLTEPLFQTLHVDPRWKRFLETIGLGEPIE